MPGAESSVWFTGSTPRPPPHGSPRDGCRLPGVDGGRMLAGVPADERRASPGSAALWRAEAMLRHDRRVALRELERCFAAGSVPEGLDGPLDGRLVATTFGFGLDLVFESIARVYMPWRGKTFDPSAREGRNRFVQSARPWVRLVWPAYRDLRPDDSAGFTSFRFDTSVGPSATAPEVSVLRLDYASCPWPVRLVLDELVDVGEGRHLGQALMRWRGRFRRVAWFSLQTRS